MGQKAQGTVIQRGDAATPELFTTIGEVAGVSGPSFHHESLDVTDLDDAVKVFLPAITYDSGEVSLDIHFEADNAEHNQMLTDIKAGTQRNFQICYGNLTDNNFAFVPADVTVLNDTIDENAHGLTTGQPVRVGTDDTLPDPLVANTTYYVIWDSANTIQLATTNANAVAGTQIDLTDQGVGNHALYYGTRYDFAAGVADFVPSAAVEDKLSGTATYKITGAVTVTT